MYDSKMIMAAAKKAKKKAKEKAARQNTWGPYVVCRWCGNETVRDARYRCMHCCAPI